MRTNALTRWWGAAVGAVFVLIALRVIGFMDNPAATPPQTRTSDRSAATRREHGRDWPERSGVDEGQGTQLNTCQVPVVDLESEDA
jgi:hypothetical protein